MKHILEKGKKSHLHGGESRETFLITYNRKKFVMRSYERKKDADYIVKLYHLLKKYNFLPKIYYQNGKNLLIEYIEGRNCRKLDTTKVAEQIGKICGRINHLKTKGMVSEDRNIDTCLKILKKDKMITQKSYLFLKKKHKHLINKLKPKKVIDFDDIYPKNFRLRKGSVYLVDLEDFDMKTKGSGIGKAFLRWFKKPNHRKRFLKGYNSIESTEYLTEEYLQLLYLEMTLFLISNKLKYSRKINPNDVRRLRQFEKGEIVEG